MSFIQKTTFSIKYYKLGVAVSQICISSQMISCLPSIGGGGGVMIVPDV